MLRRPQGDGYTSLPGAGDGFGGNGSGGGTGHGGVGLGGDGFSGIGALVKESLLLQRFAVNLINANNAADKIPVLLIRESAIVCRPGKLARQLCMIWIVYEIAINPGIRRRRFQLINQNRVIDGEPGISCKKCDEQLAARQRRIQPSVSLFLVAGTVLKHHPGIADSKVTRPTMPDV